MGRETRHETHHGIRATMMQVREVRKYGRGTRTVTLGPCRDCILSLPGLGISLEYGPGTVVGLSGMMLEHEVGSFEGERVCYVYYMRDIVHEWAHVPGGTWMKTNLYE